MTSKNIFISYARIDGRDLALRLQSSLIDNGNEVWLDTSEIEGGASWSKEIEDAIENCEIALVLLSDGSYNSDICRAEQLRCIRKKKRIIPILVQANAERPLHLEHLNYRDFTISADYKSSYSILVEDIASDTTDTFAEEYLETYTNAPALPLNFIERPEDRDRLRRELIADDRKRRIALTALQGMGGIGKSAMAAWICRDEVVQAAFPDGVIWVDVGRENVNTTELIKLVGTKLGDAMAHYSSETAALSRLRETLPDKSALIVLDDVWEVEHARLFSAIDAPQSRILFTTRDRSIGDDLGASEVRLGVLEPKQAVDLLRQWADRDLPEMPDIAKHLGYLPLGLKIAGSRLKEMTGEEWLETFKQVSRVKANRRAKSAQDNLEVCFDLSVQKLEAEDQLLYHSLGIFKEDLWIPETAAFKLWKAYVSDISNADCREIARDFHKLALVERREDDGAMLLHDILHDFNRNRMKDRNEYIDAHKKLLNSYNPREKQAWWDIEYDGYIYENLVYHKVQCGDFEFLRSLFLDDNWLRVRFKNDTYLYDGYLEDLDIVLRTTKEHAQVNSTIVYLDLVRYALIASKINQYSSIFKPDLIVRAVELGLDGWSIKRALSIAARIPAPRQRSKMYLALIKSGLIFEEDMITSQTALIIAIEQALDDREPSEFVQFGVEEYMYTEIAPYIQNDLIMFSRLLKALFQEHREKTIVTVIRSIGEFIPDDYLDWVVDTVMPMSYDYDRERSSVAYAIEGLKSRISSKKIDDLLNYHKARSHSDYEALNEIFKDDQEKLNERDSKVIAPIKVKDINIEQYLNEIDFSEFDHFYIGIDKPKLDIFSKLLPEMSKAQIEYCLQQILDLSKNSLTSNIRVPLLSAIMPYISQDYLETLLENDVFARDIVSALERTIDILSKSYVDHIFEIIIEKPDLIFWDRYIDLMIPKADKKQVQRLMNLYKQVGQSDLYWYVCTSELFSLLSSIDQDEYAKKILSSISSLRSYSSITSVQDELVERLSERRFKDKKIPIKLAAYALQYTEDFKLLQILANLASYTHYN
ncbi:MAG: NB-ARC domain-containing protein, partial [Anaerolineae bacterium]